MRRKMVGLLAFVALCGSLVAVSAMGAAAAVEESAKEPRLAVTSWLNDEHPKPAPLFEDASCSSDCCWASCTGSSSCSVTCNNTGCSASAGNQFKSVLCEAVQ